MEYHGGFMEIRTLRYFLAAAKEENMSRAAEILHVTQPTLSKALKQLETELGKKLFVRSSFSIRLTDEGILLKQRAEDLISMADKIEQEFQTLDDITGGDLYLGLAESWQISYLAAQIRIMKEKYPNLHYHITSGDSSQVIEKLEKGLLDFAVLAEEPDHSKYESIPFPQKDVWGVIMPAGDRLADKESVSAQDLKGLPLFCSPQGWNNDIRRWASKDFGSLRLEGTFQLSYNASLFVREHLGYLLTLENLIGTSESDGLCFRPLAPKAETALYLIWKKKQVFTPIADRFLNLILQ